MTKFPIFLHQPLSIPSAFIECNQAFRGTGPHLLRAHDPLDFGRPGKSEVTQTHKCVECLENMVGYGMAWDFYGWRENKVAFPWSEIENPGASLQALINNSQNLDILSWEGMFLHQRKRAILGTRQTSMSRKLLAIHWQISRLTRVNRLPLLCFFYWQQWPASSMADSTLLRG